MHVRRLIRSPSGRTWSAQVVHVPSTGAIPADQAPTSATRPVLRFVADDVVLEVETWPDNWVEFTDDQLLDLARSANPPRLGLPPLRYPDRSPVSSLG